MRSWKKIVLAAFFAAVLIVGGIVITREAVAPSRGALAPAPTSTPGQLISYSEDTDSDGLLDWEEALWRTDPNTKDTDSDGVSDGDEVKENRDPLVAGRGERTPAALSAQPPETLTTTERLSREIVNSYLALKAESSNGIGTNIVSPQTIVQQTVPPIETTTYTLADFTIVPDSDAAVLAYRDRFTEIFEVQVPSNSNDEMYEIYLALQKEGGATDFTKVKEIGERYRAAVDDLVAMPVPGSLLNLHARFVNTVSFAATGLENTLKLSTDPIVGVQAIQMYIDASTLVDQLLEEYRPFFQGLDE